MEFQLPNRICQTFLLAGFLAVFISSCASQEASDARVATEGDDVDREDFIAYPPIPATGTYLTVDNAKARCKTKGISGEEFEVTCVAVVWYNGREILASSLKSGTKLSWKAPTSKQNRFDFNSSCINSSDVSQTCRIKTKVSNFMQFGFEIADSSVSKVSTFDVLLPFSITMSGGMNLFRNFFQSPSSILNKSSSLNKNDEPKNFGFQAPRRSAFDRPVNSDYSCASDLGFFYVQGFRVMRVKDMYVDLFTNSDRPTSKLDSRHHFSIVPPNSETVPCSQTSCLRIACTNDGIYMVPITTQKLYFVPENGEVKELLKADVTLPSHIRGIHTRTDGSLLFSGFVVASNNMTVPVLQEFKDQKLEPFAGAEIGKTFDQFTTSEIAEGIPALSYRFSIISHFSSSEDGTVLVHERYLTTSLIWRVHNGILTLLASSSLINSDNVAKLEGEISVTGLLADADANPVILTIDKKIIKIENGLASQIWNDPSLASNALGMSWASAKKDSVYLNYGRQLVKKADFGDSQTPKIIAGIESTKLYKDLFKDGPRAANSTYIGDPQSIVMDDNGTVFYVDRVQNALMKIDKNGKIDMMAGGASYPLASQGQLSSLSLNRPFGLNLTKDGTLILADSLNRRVLGIKDGQYWTIAGGGSESTNCSGSVLASSAVVQNAGALAVTDDGRIFYPDWEQHCVYVISSFVRDDANRTIKGVFGNGSRTSFAAGVTSIPANEFRLNKPAEVVLLKTGDLLISEYSTGRILKLSILNGEPQSVTVHIGGNPGVIAKNNYEGPASDVRFDTTSRMSIGENDSVYFVDIRRGAIRKASLENNVMMVEPILGHMPQESCGFGSIDGSSKAESLSADLKNNLSVICVGNPVAVYVKENCAANPQSTVKMVFSQRFSIVMPSSPNIDADNSSYIIVTEWPCKGNIAPVQTPN